MAVMLKIIKGFFSLKLALPLLCILLAVAIIGGVIPQDPAATYPAGPLGILALFFKPADIFRSPFFFLALSAFSLNLGGCTLIGLRRLFKGATAWGRGGASALIHMGILVLIAGAFLSFWGRREFSSLSSVGESVELPGGWAYRIKDFRFDSYPDGRPRFWASDIELLTSLKGGDVKEPGRLVSIEVNKPERIGPYLVFQHFYGQHETARIADSAGRVHVLRGGERRLIGGVDIALVGAANPAAENPASAKPALTEGSQIRGLFALGGGETPDIIEASAGETLGSLRLVSLKNEYYTGTKAVWDPGIILVISGFGIACLGLFLLSLLRFRASRPLENR